MRLNIGKAADLLASAAAIVASTVVVWAVLSARSRLPEEKAVDRTASVRQQKESLQLPATPLTLVGAPILGDRGAAVIGIVYGDFECPFCARFARSILQQVLKEEVNRGRVQIAFRHFPLESIHPYARDATVAAVCANQQGKFWNLHDALFAREGKLTHDVIEAAGSNLDVDRARFRACRNSGEAARIVKVDAALGRAIGVTGTPASFWGVRLPDGRVRVHKAISGLPASDEIMGLVASLRSSVTDAAEK